MHTYASFKVHPSQSVCCNVLYHFSAVSHHNGVQASITYRQNGKITMLLLIMYHNWGIVWLSG